MKLVTDLFSGAFDAGERAVFIFVLAFHSAMTLRNVAFTLHAGRCVCLMYYAVRILFFQHWTGVVWSSNRPKSNHTEAAAVLEQGAADVEVRIFAKSVTGIHVKENRVGGRLQHAVRGFEVPVCTTCVKDLDGGSLQRFTIVEDGLTSYRTLRGREYGGADAELGATALFHVQGDPPVPKGAGRMKSGRVRFHNS